MKLPENQGMQENLNRVRRFLAEFLPPEREQGRMEDILTAVMSSKGKGYRPLLLLTAGRCGPSYESARDNLCRLGAIVELIHMASLVHDDIVDDSPLRRGQATIQNRFGKDMAVYTGDMILARTMGIVFREGFYQAGTLLCSTIENMCRGEIGQYDCRFHIDTPVETYLSNIYGKTVALFEAVCRIGGMESGCGEELCETLAAFGRHLGYLFQIRDDLLDFVSAESREGKPIHMDFREGIFTLPVLYTYGNPAYRDAVAALAQEAKNGTFFDEQTKQLDHLVFRSGGITATVEQMELHQNAALELTNLLPKDSVARELREILQGLTVPELHAAM